MYELIVFCSVGLILYSYGIYPIVLYLWLKATGNDQSTFVHDDICPSVTIVIAAYNEEKVIETKIQNALSLDYPSEKIEILIGSDGSTDLTDDICNRYEEIKFHRIEVRQGKANVLNKLISMASGEIIVLTDANTIFKPDAFKKMVRHFSVPSIGGVCGRLILKTDDNNLTSIEKLYWNYESSMKEIESKIYSTIAANGGIYAMRKNLYMEIPDDTIVDDLFISLNILEQNKRVFFEKEAVAYEFVSKSFNDEFWRKVRIGAGNLQIFIRKFDIFRKTSNFINFAYLSHKVIRWFIPFLLIAIYISCMKLYGQGIFTPLFIIYNISIIAAVLGIIFSTTNKVWNLISYMFAVNFALFCGYLRYIFRLQKTTWRKADR